MKKARRILAIVLAVLMLCGSMTVAFAADSGMPKFTSPSGKYVATKVTHPESGAGELDGIIDYENGDPDRGQNYSWSMVGYGDSVYVGTCYAAMWQTLKIMGKEMGFNIQQMQALMNVAFNGSLYVGDNKNNPDDVNRSIIVKVNVKTGETKVISGPHRHGGFRAATTFNDRLYFIATGATPSVVEVNPHTDTAQTIYTADKVNDPSLATGIRGITEINGKLAVSMVGDGGAFIIASENPSAGKESFKVIATQEDLFDYPANHWMDDIFGGTIWDMVSINGKLYISIVTGRQNKKQAFALVCGEEQADGTWKYRAIAGDPKDGARYPFGFGADRSGAGNLVVHNGQLYIGGYNDPMKSLPLALKMDFEFMYRDLSSPVCLWKMDPATEKVEMVIGDANEVFPEGPTGNMGAGFGDALNQYVWRMQSYNGKLFVGTFDISGLAQPVAQFVNGDMLTRSADEWKTQIEYIKVFADLMKGGNAKAAGVSDFAVASSIRTLDKLASKGGVNDVKSTEQFYKALKAVYGVYVKVHDQLPAEITSKLDTILNEENVNQFYYFTFVCKKLSQSQRGFDMFVTEDGKNFETITRDGLGDKYNHGLRTFGVTNDCLVVGTANPFYGTQVWRIDEVEKDDAPAQIDIIKDIVNKLFEIIKDKLGNVIG